MVRDCTLSGAAQRWRLTRQSFFSISTALAITLLLGGFRYYLSGWDGRAAPHSGVCDDSTSSPSYPGVYHDIVCPRVCVCALTAVPVCLCGSNAVVALVGHGEASPCVFAPEDHSPRRRSVDDAHPMNNGSHTAFFFEVKTCWAFIIGSPQCNASPSLFLISSDMLRGNFVKDAHISTQNGLVVDRNTAAVWIPFTCSLCPGTLPAAFAIH